MRLGYLYSRYPVISQTFCDAEMLALERRGIELAIGSVYPPLTSLRHEHIARLRAPIHYAPPQEILKILENATRKLTAQMAARSRRAARAANMGPGAKAEQRARNAFTSPSSLREMVSIMYTCISQIAQRTLRFF